MNHSRLILNELEETLAFWEDICEISLLQKKITATGNTKWQGIANSIGNFSYQAIEQYGKLRTALQNKQIFNPMEFLPRVEQDAVDWLDKVNFARGKHLDLAAACMSPYMIGEWMKTKRVYRVEEDNIIPLMSPKKKNYLNLLPLDSFVINFLEPVEIGFETSPLIKRYKSCIVVRSGKLVDTFWIPEELESRSLRPRGRKLLRSIFQGKNVNEKHLREFAVYMSSLNLLGKPPFFVNASFHIEEPLMFAWHSKKKDHTVVDLYHDLYQKGTHMVEEHNGKFTDIDMGFEDTPRLEDSIKFHKFFFELLNGFCYVLSEIKPKNLVTISGNKTPNDQLPQNFVWNEIPITKVDYLEEDLSNSDPLKVSYGSGEKSRHFREAHWRTIVKKDGTIERIRIEQIEVRKDKDWEELKGSVTRVKQKRVDT